MPDWLTALKELIEEIAPTLAVMLWNYEQAKVVRANDEKNKAETDLKVEKSHEAIDAKYADSTDSDIVNDAIVNGGGDRGQLETVDAPSGPDNPTTTGNGLGQAPSDPKKPTGVS